MPENKLRLRPTAPGATPSALRRALRFLEIPGSKVIRKDGDYCIEYSIQAGPLAGELTTYGITRRSAEALFRRGYKYEVRTSTSVQSGSVWGQSALLRV